MIHITRVVVSSKPYQKISLTPYLLELALACLREVLQALEITPKLWHCVVPKIPGSFLESSSWSARVNQVECPEQGPAVYHACLGIAA
jgi:hypothetical protein